MKKILISTGGSGGHVFPAIAIFEHLTHKFDIQLVTDIRGSRFLDKNWKDIIGKFQSSISEEQLLFNKLWDVKNIDPKYEIKEQSYATKEIQVSINKITSEGELVRGPWKKNLRKNSKNSICCT